MGRRTYSDDFSDTSSDVSEMSDASSAASSDYSSTSSSSSSSSYGRSRSKKRKDKKPMMSSTWIAALILVSIPVSLGVGTYAAIAANKAAPKVGTIHLSTEPTNPGDLFGGTWEQFSQGRMLIGEGGGYTANTVGGSANAIVPAHTHTVTDSGHTHTLSEGGSNSGDGQCIESTLTCQGTGASTSSSNANIVVNSAGVSATGANMPPYMVVYMWRMTSE